MSPLTSGDSHKKSKSKAADVTGSSGKVSVSAGQVTGVRGRGLLPVLLFQADKVF